MLKRFAFLTYISSAILTHACLAGDANGYLFPDTEDFNIVESCLKAHSQPERYGRYVCIGLVAERCLSLNLPIEDHLCDDRERRLWEDVKYRYFRLIFDGKSVSNAERDLLYADDKQWSDNVVVRCAHEVNRHPDTSPARKDEWFRCNRNESAEQAIKYIRLSFHTD